MSQQLYHHCRVADFCSLLLTLSSPFVAVIATVFATAVAAAEMLFQLLIYVIAQQFSAFSVYVSLTK